MDMVDMQVKKIGANEIRDYSARAFVMPARQQGRRKFSIRVGDIVRELKLYRSVANVCSALKTEEFLQSNHLKLVDAVGPKSGLSTTVVYTYEFVGPVPSSDSSSDAWSRLRGAMKEVFAELGGGEAYLRAERSDFYPPEERE